VPRTLSKTQVEDFRDRLIETATRLFAERGREAFTMRHLAAELGCSAMTPYRYFKDKDEILAAVRANAFDNFAQVLEAAFENAANPAERGVAVGNAYVKFAFEHPESYKLMFDLTQPEESTYPDLVRASTRARLTMTTYVSDLVAGGILEGNPITIGVVFWAALHGAVVLQLYRADGATCRRCPAFGLFRALFAAYAKRG